MRIRTDTKTVTEHKGHGIEDRESHERKRQTPATKTTIEGRGIDTTIGQGKKQMRT
jgi:hypothetical protein